MATNIVAMKAKLGNTNYYILSMKARALVEKVTIPKESADWVDMSIEERYQRDINYHRVKTQIAPYLATDETRFFGAFIIAAMNFDEHVSFEPLSDVVTKDLPKMYRIPAKDIGFLTFQDGEIFVPLDGQHRLKAIKFAITGQDEWGRDIPGISPCTALAQEDVTVILVAYEKEKSRRIFTRVNAYARKTTTGQNIVTDDDDIVASLARKVAGKIGSRLVKYKNNTLKPRDPEFTTLSTLYTCNKEIIIRSFPGGNLSTTQLPDIGERELYEGKVMEVWELLKKDIVVFADALSDITEKTGDKKRHELRSSNLLAKPVTQECLVRAFLRLTDSTNRMTGTEACQKLNKLPWGITEENIKIWDRVLWTGGANDGKIITKNRNLTTDIIAYLAGEKISDEKQQALLDNYLKLFPEDERKGKKLPQPIL